MLGNVAKDIIHVKVTFWLWEDSGSRGNAQKRQALEHKIQIKLAVLDLLYALWLNAVLV